VRRSDVFYVPMKLREVLTVLIIMVAKSLAGSWKFNLSTTKSLFKIRAGNVNVKAPSNTESRTTGYAIKVVTDIDDTVVSSGGLNIFGIHLGGVDNQYKRGTFYPGVIQFGLELSSATAKSAQSIPAKMAVLTARAKEFKFALALKPTGKLCSAFRKRGEENGVEDWGIGDVYYGSVNEWIFQAQKGKRKFLNFEIMMQADQDSGLGVDQYVIVGDTGEKDEEAAERIIAKHPERVKAVFLHSVFDTKPPKSMQFPLRISRSSSRNSSSGRTAATTTAMAAAATTTTTTTTVRLVAL